MVVCKLCYSLFGKWRTHCPTCGCARLPNGKIADFNTGLVITRRNHRSVSKFGMKVSAR